MVIARKSMAVLKTVTPTPGTPTAQCRGKRGKIDGIPVWLKGESPAGGDDSQSPYHERAAFIVNEILDFKLVPPTILHLEKGEVVSAMKWVRGKYPHITIPPLLMVFDYIISNSDRHNGNWLVKPSGRVWAIDNALTFHTGVGDYCDGELPDKIRTNIKRALKDTRTLRRRLSPLLEKDRIDALIKRMRTLVRNGK